MKFCLKVDGTKDGREFEGEFLLKSSSHASKEKKRKTMTILYSFLSPVKDE